MRFLNRIEAADLEMGYRSRDCCEGQLSQPVMGQHVTHRFVLPDEFDPLLSAMRLLYEIKFADEEFLLIIDSAGIWPSREDRNLYGMMRTARGGARDDWEAGSGHLLLADETEDLASFTAIFATFRWDFRVIGSSYDFALESSHDDVCFVRTLQSNAEKISDILDRNIHKRQ